MKKTLLTLTIVSMVSIAFVQCGKDTDPYLIENGAIGNLTKETKMKQVDSIFSNDSIVKLNPVQGTIGTQGEVAVFDKDGTKLLLLSPDNENDPNSEITNIQVFDKRYKTKKGLNVGSTFKDVKANYTIDNVETTINAVVVFLKDTDVYLTIDKKNLPENLRYNMDAKVETSQIPDDAPFKYFMIGWEHSEKKPEKTTEN
jgi:hypothetical protein